MMLLSTNLSKASDSLTPQNVYNYCESIGILHPEIVTAQSIEETGWYKCGRKNGKQKGCSLDKNNIFGFYYKGSYMRFDSWKASCDYYKRWQDKYYDSTRNYYEYLACMYVNSKGDCVRYATSPTYIGKIKSIVSDYSQQWE